MKALERTLMLALFLVIAGACYVLFNSANSQSFTGTVQNHAIPIGKGPGVSGMTSLLPGTNGTILRSNGASADPSYSSAALLLDTICTTQGAFIYRNATVWGCLPPGTAGQPLLTGGAGANPAYGTLGVPAGGTGLTGGTSGAVPYFNSANTIASSAVLTANQLLIGGGAGLPPVVIGSLGTAAQVLHGNAAGAPTFGAVALGTGGDITGALPEGNGGTNQTTYAQGDLLYATAANTLDKLAKDTNATRYLSNTGTSNAPAWAQVTLTTGASDYVEGTWTPVIAGSTTAGTQTYTVQLGRYVQIGNQITVFGRVTTSAIGGTIAGNVLVTGLPSTARNVTNLAPACSIASVQNIAVSVGFFFWGMFVANNTTTIQMLESRTANSSQGVPVANLGAATDLIFSCTYLK